MSKSLYVQLRSKSKEELDKDRLENDVRMVELNFDSAIAKAEKELISAKEQHKNDIVKYHVDDSYDFNARVNNFLYIQDIESKIETLKAMKEEALGE